MTIDELKEKIKDWPGDTLICKIDEYGEPIDVKDIWILDSYNFDKKICCIELDDH